MAPRTIFSSRVSPRLADPILPTVCVVAADEDFRAELFPELSPWFDVVTRETYRDVARWTREAGAVALILDIDTDGEEAHGGLAVLNELRRSDEGIVLISISRSRTRSVEKLAHESGAERALSQPG